MFIKHPSLNSKANYLAINLISASVNKHTSFILSIPKYIELLNNSLSFTVFQNSIIHTNDFNCFDCFHDIYLLRLNTEYGKTFIAIITHTIINDKSDT